MLAYADLFIVFQVLTLFLIGAILWFTLRAYRLTGLSFLATFFLGFLLLESSFAFVLLNRLVGHTGLLYHGTFWIHETMQTAAFAFMASAYYFRNKQLSSIRIVVSIVASIIIVVLSVFAFLSIPSDVAFAWRTNTSPYFYSVNLALLLYAVYHVSTSSPKSSSKSKALVPAGFAILALSQILWVYWGFTDLDPALVLANAFYVAGLTPLVAALLMIAGRRHKYAEVH